MRRKTQGYALYFALCVGMFLIANWRTVSADIVAARSDYTVEVGDGDYVFVMLAIDGGDYVFCCKENRHIRNQYNQSGLYHVDNPEEPLWTVDWYAYGVSLSDDGQYLVRWDNGRPSRRGFFNETAIAFYEEDNLLKHYRVIDLVRNPFTLHQSVSHYRWLVAYREASVLDPFTIKENTLFVETNNGESYLFDITTGEILEQSHFHFGPFDRYIWLCVLMIIVLGIILVRRRSV